MSAKTASVCATIVLIASAIALVVRGALFGNGPISIGLQLAGLALMIWARITFGMRSFHYAANPTEGGLVTNGPFHYMRNPIYAAIWLICWVGVAVHWSPVNVALGIIIAVALTVRILCEEQLLRAAYPDYAEYARRTKRLVPFII